MNIPRVLITVLLTCDSLAIQSNIGLTPTQLIQKHGYPCETHYITTEDGYILTFYRIPSTKPPILLVHGLFGSAAEFVNEGTQSLAFFLSNSGYDVWLANARGNAFSRNHTTLDPVRDQKYFFNFSWHEIGYYDLPASIDYILKLRNEDSLYYIGHSQGTTTFLVMSSTRPEYNKRIKIAHLLAPSAFMVHCPNKILVGVSQEIDQLAELAKQLKIYEVPLTHVLRRVLPRLCSDPLIRIFCEFVATVWVQSKAFDMDLLPVLLTNAPSNAALNQVIHYGQLIKRGKFQQFDYGKKKNLVLYGTEVPPSYNVSEITAPVALYYATSDRVQAVKDIRTLKNLLPNVVLDYLVPRKSFNHLDFLFAADVVNLVYNKVLETNEKY